MSDKIKLADIASVVFKSPDGILRQLKALNDELTAVQAPIVLKVQQLLSQLEGARWASLEANKDVATEFQLLLNRLGYWIKCPHNGCNEPAVLECRPAGGSKNGIFQFRHRLRGKQANHSSGAKLPKMRLIPAPPDGRRRRRPKIR